MIATIKKALGIGGHVAAGHMIAYLDRELPRRQARRVRDHLLRCAVCREELGSMRDGVAAWERTAELHTPSATTLLAGRERLLRAVGVWAVLHEPAFGTLPVARAADELSIYARSSGDYLRLHGDGESARRALTKLDPVLAAFLGKATASSLRSLVTGILPPPVGSMVSEAV